MKPSSWKPRVHHNNLVQRTHPSPINIIDVLSSKEAIDSKINISIGAEIEAQIEKNPKAIVLHTNKLEKDIENENGKTGSYWNEFSPPDDRI